MRIDFLEYAAMDLPRREPFTIARGSSTVAQNVMVVVHSGSLSGNGSGAPTDVTGETVRSAMDAIKTMALVEACYQSSSSGGTPIPGV